MNVKKLAISALFVAQLLANSALTQGAETKAVAPPSISVLTAEKKSIAEDLTVTGSFAAGELVLVSPEIEGLAVTEFLAEEGDTVKKDQVLARLNSASIDIQITQSNASLARNNFAQDQAKNAIDQAQINRDHASADLERTKKLRTGGIATQQTLDQFQAAFDLADAQLSNAKLGLEAAQADRVGIEAQLAGLKLNKSRTEIKSPVDGYVSNRTVQIGGIASGSKNPMYQIVASGIVKLVAEVPESELPRVKVGQKATITINGYDKPIDGEVRLISPEVNETTRVGLVHIRVADDVRIALGTFGRARISVAAAEGVALPLTAVTFGDSGPTVQIVKDNKIQVRKVITGLVGTDNIEITSGVQSGEIFVARAGSFVRDGDAVTPVPLTAQ
ncbi:MAG: efflux RND transporter periplasmic adaptor subunit [Aestuariivirga sp.]